MLIPQPFYKKSRFWRWALSFSLIALLIYAFWGEFSTTWKLVSLIEAYDVENLQHIHSILVIVFVLLALIEFFFLFLLLVSQFVLPVQKPSERWRVFNRLWMYFTGVHGPAVFIKEGEEIARPEELKSSRPGVAFVDLTSAIALERQSGGGGASTRIGARQRKQSTLNLSGLYEMMFPPPQRGRRSQVRAAGPGIVFTEFGERIRGTVSLRRQFRMAASVRGTMRDGFEVSTQVWCLFTLGEPAEVLKIACQGAAEAENLRVLKMDEMNRVIQGFSDELDQEDKWDAYRMITGAGSVLQLEEEEIEEEEEGALFKAPYTFDPDRVFKAVYGEARSVKDGNIEDWTQLPVKVAVEIFHDMISVENYDALYMPNDPANFPLRSQFIPSFSTRVRNQGVLAYQFVQRRDGKPIQEGQVWDENELEIFSIQAFRSSKVLRDRGIRVIASGFSELKPTNQAVLDRRLDHWRARWQRDANVMLAGFEYQALKVRARARREAQQDIGEAFRKVLDQDLPDEVLAMRVLQALESFANEPETTKRLPNETTNNLTNLKQWLL